MTIPGKFHRAALGRVAILLLVCAQPFAARAADCESKLLADVRVLISPDGQVFLPATIGDRQVYFVFSIGSGLPMLLESSASALGLTPQRMNGTGKFSSGVTHFVKLEGLKVGDFQFANRAAPIIPEARSDGPRMVEDRLLAGTIGSTLFQHVDVELNLAERQLKLFRPFRCLNRPPVEWAPEAAKLPMRFDEAGALKFTLELNGKRVEASMLSNERESTIDVNVARQYFGFDENSPDVRVVEPGSGGGRKVFHAMSLTGSGLQLADTPVQLRPGNDCRLTGSMPGHGAIGYANCYNIVPFNLGMDLLSQMLVYVSSERKAVFVKFLPKAAAN